MKLGRRGFLGVMFGGAAAAAGAAPTVRKPIVLTPTRPTPLGKVYSGWDPAAGKDQTVLVEVWPEGRKGGMWEKDRRAIGGWIWKRDTVQQIESQPGFWTATRADGSTYYVPVVK